MAAHNPLGAAITAASPVGRLLFFDITQDDPSAEAVPSEISDLLVHAWYGGGSRRITQVEIAMKITARAAIEVASHEGIVRQAYKDSVGVWTWSVGLTSATGHNVRRYIDNPQPLEKCLSIFVWALNNYAEAVRAEFEGHVLSEAQFAAALSFHWNTGAIRSASWPDHWKRGDVEAARNSFMAWRKPEEIIPRREAECALFFDGKWSGNGTMTEYTRVTSRHTPVWSSAKRIEIGPAMKAILGAPETPEEQEAPAPDPFAMIASIEQALADLKAALGART